MIGIILAHDRITAALEGLAGRPILRAGFIAGRDRSRRLGSTTWPRRRVLSVVCTGRKSSAETG